MKEKMIAGFNIFKKIKISTIQSNTLKIFFLLGAIKATGLFRDILVGYYFGVNKYVDIYLYVMVFCFFVYNIFSGSFYLYFVPNYLEIRARQGHEHAYGYFSYIFRFMLLLLAIISIVLGWIFPKLLVLFNHNILGDVEIYGLYMGLSQWAAVFLFFFTAASFLVTLLQAEHFYVASFCPQIFVPLTSFAFVVLTHKQFHISSVVYGATVGAILYFLILFLLIKTKKVFCKYSSTPQPIFLKLKLEQFIILVLTCLFPSFINLIDRQMAINLGEGKLTSLSYGVIIPDGLYDILSIGLGIASFSYFAEWYAQDKKQLITEAFQKVIIYATYFILPVCVFLIVYAEPLLSFFFERGAFSGQDTLAVMGIMKIYSVMIYLTIPIIVGIRIISTIGKNQIFLVIILIAFFIKILLNYFFIRKFDVCGLPSATISMFCFNNGAILLYLRRKGFHVFDAKVLRFFSLGLACTIVFMILNLFLFKISHIYADLPRITLGIAILLAYFASIFIFAKYNKLYLFKS